MSRLHNFQAKRWWNGEDYPEAEDILDLERPVRRKRAVKLIATVKTKQVDPIFNVQDPRKVVLFFCELRIEGSDEVIGSSRIWCSTEEQAIDSARQSLAEIAVEVTRDYVFGEFEVYPDGWRQLRVKNNG